MPSPFPGMDPYLESRWGDVHTSLITYTRDVLQGVLPDPLRARVEERVVLETPSGLEPNPRIPDVRIVEYPPTRGHQAQPRGGLAVAEPILVDAEPEPYTERFIEIIDRESGNRVVTVIEYLSPSNKIPGPSREQYLRKQREICSSNTNLVEINLNRYGIHTLAFPIEHLRSKSRTPYIASVRRATRAGVAEVYPMPLWERLPILKIPLRPDDADVPLDLQAIVEQCYRNGAYEGTLNYAVDPEPPLYGVEAKWADGWLREKGTRPRKRQGRGKQKRKAT